MYDLGYDYVLNETKFWNANEPKHLDFGINEYHLDYSLDGVTWTNLGTYNMDQASGLSYYEGDAGPDFDSAKARYVLITPRNTLSMTEGTDTYDIPLNGGNLSPGIYILKIIQNGKQRSYKLLKDE